MQRPRSALLPFPSGGSRAGPGTGEAKGTVAGNGLARRASHPERPGETLHGRRISASLE